PTIVAVGSRRRSSAASAPSYRSPDGSPQEIMTRTVRTLAGLVEQRGIYRHVELEGPHGPVHRWSAIAPHVGDESHFQASYIAIVGVAFLHLDVPRRAAQPILRPDQQRR